MTFSNPKGNAAATAQSYVRALLDVLGDLDPLTVLGELMPWMDERMRGLPESAWRRAEAPGKWSVVQVVQHLADSDLVFGFRARMILTEDRPALQGYDQDGWATVLRYADASLGDALAQLGTLRRANLDVLRHLAPAEWDRVGIHNERGPESLGNLTKLMAAHDLVNRRQIDRVLARMR